MKCLLDPENNVLGYILDKEYNTISTGIKKKENFEGLFEVLLLPTITLD